MILSIMELKVVPIDPDGKPHIKNLHESIRAIIDAYAENGNLTNAEVIGALEMVKLDFYQDLLDECD